MQIWAETGKSALPIHNYSQILYQFLMFTQNLKRSPLSRFWLFTLSTSEVSYHIPFEDGDGAFFRFPGQGCKTGKVGLFAPLVYLFEVK